MLLVVVRAVPMAVRAVRTVRSDTTGDRASRALALAVRGLPPERAGWGNAMLAELGEVHDAQSAPALQRRLHPCGGGATAAGDTHRG